MGPKAREVLQAVSPADFSNEVNPFGTAQEIELGFGMARVHRVTYVGELGWEIYVSADMAGHAFEVLHEAGQAHGMKLCGMHMMDSCRIEKGFRHFGHDITCEDHVLEAGLGFAVKTAKPDFIGRDAVLRKKEEGLSARMMQFKLTDPEPLLYHNEPLHARWRDHRLSQFRQLWSSPRRRPWGWAMCRARARAPSRCWRRATRSTWRERG